MIDSTDDGRVRKSVSGTTWLDTFNEDTQISFQFLKGHLMFINKIIRQTSSFVHKFHSFIQVP